MANKILNNFRNFRKLQRDGLPQKAKLPSSEESICQNCGNHFAGKFCPACGQAASTRRITVRDTLNNIFAGFIGGDDIFFRTCLNLLWRPGYMIYDYLSGKRAGYFKPIHMLVRLVAIYVLIILIFGLHVEEIKLVDGVDVQSNTLEAIIPFVTKLMNNKVFSSLALAFFSLIPFWFTFRFCTIRREDAYTKKLNIAEQFFTLIFINCLLMIVAFPFLCISFDSSYKVLATNIETLIAVIVPIWAYRQLYNISWLRSILLTITAMIFSIALTIIVVILAFGIFYGIDNIGQESLS